MQRYFVKERKGDFLVLDKGDIHHIQNVMRNKSDDLIECVYDGDLFLCRIGDLKNDEVFIVSKEVNDHQDLFPLTVAIGLVKEQKMDLILQKLTELGVSAIIPLKLERSIVKLGDERISKKMMRWEKICKEAAEQSKRTSIPKIWEPMSLEALKNLSFDYQFVGSTNDVVSLNVSYLQGIDPMATMIFVIGPEGGISSVEEEKLVSFGYVPVSFGKRIMRVETAAIYVASVMNLMREG